MGGSAVPAVLFEKTRALLKAELVQGWGMTEMSPLGVTGNLLPKHSGLAWEDELKIRVKQGRPVFGVEQRIVDDNGKILPRDGVAFGNLQVRGPWIVQRYYKESKDCLTTEPNNDLGWFPTGDIATIDPDGYMQITDRAKDVIKSGGEWISSIDLENVVMNHEGVKTAAAISVPHPKWAERPLLVVVKNVGYENLKKEDLLKWLSARVAKWWIPDDVVFVDEIPFTATGKIEKKKLRDIYKDFKWPAKL